MLTVNNGSVDVGVALGEMVVAMFVAVSGDAADREVPELVHLVRLLAGPHLRTTALRPVVERVAGRCRVAVCPRARVGVALRYANVGRIKSRVVTSWLNIQLHSL